MRLRLPTSLHATAAARCGRLVAVAMCVAALGSGLGFSARAGEGFGENRKVTLWPLLESRDLDSGAWRTTVLLIFHMTRESSGDIYSWHAGPYFQGPDYNVLFPFYARTPDLSIAPPLLSWRARLSGGGSQTWITPLYHHTRDAGGELSSWHFGPYFQGDTHKVLFPLAYSVGEPGEKHRGIVPLYFQGPEYKVFLPFLTAHWRGSDGWTRTWMTPLYHHTRDINGDVVDQHLLTFARGADYRVLFPLAYIVGPEEDRHRGVIPAYFGGPRYRLVPPLLSAWWKGSDDRTHTWMTPLYHHTRDAAGALTTWHLGPYVQGEGYKIFFPLAYSVGAPEAKHRAVVPVLFTGPEYAIAPPLLSARVTGPEGGTSTWITPLAHWSKDDQGTTTDSHFLTYFRGPRYKVLFPFAYAAGDEGEKHRGVVPFAFTGPDYGVYPALLSARAKSDASDVSTWVTPLFHYTRRASGEVRDWHAGPFFSGENYKVLFPLWYSAGAEGFKHQAFLPPLLFHGPGYTVSPLLMTGKWEHRGGGESTWVTPLYHKTVSAAGELEHRHVLTYFEGRDYKVLFPFAYSIGSEGQRHQGFVPFYFGGPDYKVSPPLMSAWWRTSTGAQWTWISPLMHRKVDADGTLAHAHALTYFQGRNYKVLFPLAYSIGRPGERHQGIVPLAFWGPGYFAAPPLAPLFVPLKSGGIVPIALSAYWEGSGGDRTILVSPLFHRTVNADGTLRHAHALNYFRGPGYRLFLPIGYSIDSPRGRHAGVVPVYFQGPDYKVSPPLMTGWWRHRDGGVSVWATPLFHRTVDAAGGLVHLHAGTYFQGEDYKILAPVAYSVGERGAKHRGVIPLAFSGPTYRILPPLFSAGARRDTGEKSNWYTPLAHRSTDALGVTTDYHVGPYFSGPAYRVLFPLAYSVGAATGMHRGVVPLFFSGPGYRVVPTVLSAHVRRDEGSSTWITPLFHATRSADGSVRDMHAATYFSGPGYKVLAPLGYSVGSAGAKHRAVVPLAFTGPTYGIVPPLLSASTKKAGKGASRWITPLFHVTRNEDGTIRDWHAGPVFSGPRYDLVLPLYYSLGPKGARHSGLIPFYFEGPTYKFSPLTFWGRAGDGSVSTWITPLFHSTYNRDGTLRHRHGLVYFETARSKVIFPFYWQHTNWAKVTYRAVPPFALGRSASRGRLSTSHALKLWPILYQQAGSDYECAVLWRAFYVRRTGTRKHTSIFWDILWASDRPHPKVPMECRFLGGLVARDCDFRRGTYRYRVLWFIPVGKRRTFTPQK
jgi:hypothetical protein